MGNNSSWEFYFPFYWLLHKWNERTSTLILYFPLPTQAPAALQAVFFWRLQRPSLCSRILGKTCTNAHCSSGFESSWLPTPELVLPEVMDPVCHSWAFLHHTDRARKGKALAKLNYYKDTKTWLIIYNEPLATFVLKVSYLAQTVFKQFHLVKNFSFTLQKRWCFELKT